MILIYLHKEINITQSPNSNKPYHLATKYSNTKRSINQYFFIEIFKNKGGSKIVQIGQTEPIGDTRLAASSFTRCISIFIEIADSFHCCVSLKKWLLTIF